MKKFEIAMVIQAIDKVTGPARGITASIRKMAAQSEQATVRASKRGAEHVKHASERVRLSERLGEGFGLSESFKMIPELAGIGLGVAGLVEGFKKLTEASDEAAAAQTRLSNMMLHVKGNTKADVAQVNELADKLEGKTAYKHTIFEMAASQLSAFGMNGRQVKAMLPAMADYLAMQNGIGATNEDAIMGAKLLGKAYAGNVGALRRAGIVFSKAQEAILKTGTASQRTAVLIKGIEGKGGGLAAKQLLDPKGQIQQAGNVWEKVKEKAGAALTPIRLFAMHALSGALPYVSKFADDLPKMLSSSGAGLRTVGSFLSANFSKGFAGANIGGFMKTFDGLRPLMLRVFGPIIPIVAEVWAFVAKALGQIAKWLVALWINAQPGLKALVEAFEPLIGVLANLWHKILRPLWDNVLAPLLGWLIGKLAPFLINILGPAFKFLGKVIGWTLNLIIDLISGLFSWLGKVWPIVAKFFVNLWSKIKQAFGVFKTVLTVIWQEIWGGLFKWLQDKWGGFLDIFRKVGDFFGFGGSSAAPGTGRPQPQALGGNIAPMPIGGLSMSAIGGGGVATVNGQIHVSHAPGLKVRVSGDAFGDFNSHLGIQGIH